MLVKVVLLGVIVVASAAMGNLAVARENGRRKTLVTMVNCVKSVRNAMLYQGMQLKDAIKYAGGIGMRDFFNACADIMAKHPEYTGHQVCSKALESCPVEGLEGEEGLLKDLFKELSEAVIGEEIGDACTRFIKELQRVISVAGEQRIKKARLVRTMCLLSGMVIAIILI